MSVYLVFKHLKDGIEIDLILDPERWERASSKLPEMAKLLRKKFGDVGAIWNFVHGYNRLIGEKIAGNELSPIFSVLY
ncbi:MAG: hypothetical protein WA885_03240 [Phormidesmis sp.]